MEKQRLDLEGLEVESLEFEGDASTGGLESLRMGHGTTEVGASCCCCVSVCSCSLTADDIRQQQTDD